LSDHHGELESGGDTLTIKLSTPVADALGKSPVAFAFLDAFALSRLSANEPKHTPDSR